MTLYTLSIYSSVHNQLLRMLFERRAVHDYILGTQAGLIGGVGGNSLPTTTLQGTRIFM